jgi:hypothetical protein
MLPCKQVSSLAKFFGQDVWANIWSAVLAVGWPSRGGRCAVALAGSGGAAVALALIFGLYPNRVCGIKKFER